MASETHTLEPEQEIRITQATDGLSDILADMGIS